MLFVVAKWKHFIENPFTDLLYFFHDFLTDRVIFCSLLFYFSFRSTY